MVFCSFSFSSLLIFLHVKIKLALAHSGSLAIKSYTIQNVQRLIFSFPLSPPPYISMHLISDTLRFLMLRTPWKIEFHCQKCTYGYRCFFCLSGQLLFIYGVVHLLLRWNTPSPS